MKEELKVKFIAGFWRRVGAFTIDTFILGLFGLFIGIGLEKKFVALGSWGKLIGFFIALIYFGVMNSKIYNGQTIGKKLLKIRVVNCDNNSISLHLSLVRYCILGIPFFLNGAHFTTNALTSIWLYPLSFIIFGGIISTLYLCIFNRINRQTLHDLVVGTYVVRANSTKEPINSLWKPHLIVISIIFIAAGTLPFFTTSLAEKMPFNELQVTQKLLLNEPLVNYVSIQYGKNAINGKSNTFSSAQIFLNENNISDKLLAKKFASILLKNFKDANQKDVLQINLIYGYDIGIASKWNNRSFIFNPKDLSILE